MRTHAPKKTNPSLVQESKHNNLETFCLEQTYEFEHYIYWEILDCGWHSEVLHVFHGFPLGSDGFLTLSKNTQISLLSTPNHSWM